MQKKNLGSLSRRCLAAIFISVFIAAFVSVDVNDIWAKKDCLQQPGWWTGYSTAIPNVAVPEGYPPLPTHARYIGHLQGSWHHMGETYGRRAGDLMLLVFNGWYTGVSAKMSWEEIIYRIHKYEDETLKWYCPELLEFARGMADGAAGYLKQSTFHKEYGITPYEMVLAMNLYFEINVASPMLPASTSFTVGKAAEIDLSNVNLRGCSGIALLPKATAAEKLIHANSRDQSFWPQAYTVMYTMKHRGKIGPSGKPKMIYKVSTAGEIGGIQVGNDKGFTIGAFAGGNKGVRENPLYPDFAFGVPWQLAMAQTGIFSSHLQEGIDNLVHGSNYYRSNTGRKIVQEAWGLNYLLSDPDEACTVEMIPYRYAVRYPGDAGETDSAYIVQTNHNVCTYSYDENDIKTDVPMTQFGDGYDPQMPSGIDGSGTRFWTLTWLAEHNFGDIDEHLIMDDFWTRDFYINPEGYRIDYLWVDGEGWVPSHTAHRTVANAPGARGGQVDVHVAVPSEFTFYWTIGTAPDWIGPWDSWVLKKKWPRRKKDDDDDDD